jgi:hypothetical protein
MVLKPNAVDQTFFLQPANEGQNGFACPDVLVVRVVGTTASFTTSQAFTLPSNSCMTCVMRVRNARQHLLFAALGYPVRGLLKTKRGRGRAPTGRCCVRGWRRPRHFIFGDRAIEVL